MLNRFLCATIFYTAIGFLCPSNVAMAQSCNANHETVTKLYHPNSGSFSVWQTNYGEDDRAEELKSLALPIDGDQGAVAVGQVQERAGAIPKLAILRVDYRGRPIWDYYIDVKGLDRVVKILQRPDGYIVAATTAEGAWIGFFDAGGKLLDKKIIASKGAVFDIADMTADVETKGWIVAINKTITSGSGNNKDVRHESSIYKIDTSGNIIWNRSFPMGGDNEILSITKTSFSDGGSGYIATGYLENGIGKKMGLAMRIDEDGLIIWQQEFSRGLNAQLKVAAGYLNKYVLVFGDVRPSDAGTIGSWLALLDASDGNVRWQRYYEAEKGGHDYLARGIFSNKDNLITLLMEAKASENTHQIKITESDKNGEIKIAEAMIGDITVPERTSYAHVLTLSPRGVTIAGDSYFEGNGVITAQIIEGPRGERIISGGAMSQSSAASVPRDFVPDWDKDFSYGPEQPPKELALAQPKVMLPDAPMSENAKSGLALLTKKLKEQGEEQKGQKDIKTSAEHTSEDDSQKQSKLDKTTKDVQKENESKSTNKETMFSQNFWIVAGESPPPYTDPCKIPHTELPKEE